MNRTGRLALVPALILVCSGATFGQQLGDAAKRAPSADAAAIQRHVDAAVKNLTSDDPEKQGRGRDDLAGGVVIAADPNLQASPVFLDAYAGAVAKALAPLTSHEDMRVRLNAAIANARVAERAGGTRLTDVTIRFMNDKTTAVALWGVKAARALLPAALAQGGDSPLLKAFTQVVERVLTGAAITEIYDALSLDIFRANPPPQPAVIKGAVPVMIRVFRVRVDSYGGGSPPPDPAVDNVASEFLSFGRVWQQMTPAQRTEAVQTMADLLSYAGQYAQLMEGADRADLMPIFKRTGAALQVIGDANKMPAVSTAAKAVQQASTGMDGTEIVQRVTTLTDALKQAFPGLKDPPRIQLAPLEGENAGAPAGEVPPDEAAPAGNGAAPGKAPPAGTTPPGSAPPAGRPPTPGKASPPARPGQPRSAAPQPDAGDAQQAGDAQPSGDAPPSGGATPQSQGQAPGQGAPSRPAPPR